MVDRVLVESIENPLHREFIQLCLNHELGLIHVKTLDGIPAKSRHIQEIDPYSLFIRHIERELEPEDELGMHPDLQLALASHQAKAFEYSRNHCDVMLATPTASGKSICYQLAVRHSVRSILIVVSFVNLRSSTGC